MPATQTGAYTTMPYNLDLSEAGYSVNLRTANLFAAERAGFTPRFAARFSEKSLASPRFAAGLRKRFLRDCLITAEPLIETARLTFAE